MAGQYDNRLTKAQSAAKARWGAGWAYLSDAQREGAIALALVTLISQIDFEDTFKGRLDEPETAAKLLQKLVDIADVCSKLKSE